ncbi:proteinase-activated receptor 3 [Boleophthalmus pectinirostris]|uniref:proteinase-activated receptor 3 n=1 Tax=Boleophthalmus pectinirostris TaxID=150288 RepID=UPI0024317D7F|nr:proteinase-activated receptor 3 [Boleophthalmus pectinirostris]
MDKVLLFVVVLGLCFDSSLHDNVQNEKSRNKTSNFSSIAEPRTFWGKPVVLTGFSSGRNRTGAPSPAVVPDSMPELLLNSNKTASYLQGPISTILIPVLYILILAVGVPANLFTLCSLASKVRKVSSAILYCSLALSDLLLLLSLVFRAHYHLRGNQWLFGEAACRMVSACFYGNLYCSAQTLASISVKRYLAVAHPFMYKSLPKRMCTTWVTVVLWMVLGAGLVPELLVHQSYRIPQLNIITCHDILPLGSESHRFLLYYNLFFTIFGLILPLVVSVVCYVRILAELKQSHTDWGLYIRSSSLVLLIFLVCFTPAGVLHFIHYVQLFTDGTETLYMYFNVAVCLCCLHAAMDPFLFILMSHSTGSNPYVRTFKSKSLSIST